jgi:hypothetical protein
VCGGGSKVALAFGGISCCSDQAPSNQLASQATAVARKEGWGSGGGGGDGGGGGGGGGGADADDEQEVDSSASLGRATAYLWAPAEEGS